VKIKEIKMNFVPAIILGCIILLVVSVAVAEKIAKHKEMNEVKFHKSIQQFFEYCNKKYTEHNHPTDLAWVFNRFLGAIPPKYCYHDNPIDFMCLFDSEFKELFPEQYEKIKKENAPKTFRPREIRRSIIAKRKLP